MRPKHKIQFNMVLVVTVPADQSWLRSGENQQNILESMTGRDDQMNLTCFISAATRYAALTVLIPVHREEYVRHSPQDLQIRPAKTVGPHIRRFGRIFIVFES